MRVVFFLFVFSSMSFWLTNCDLNSTDSTPLNRPPVITSIAMQSDSVLTYHYDSLFCEARDPDGDPLTYNWIVPGEVIGSGPRVKFAAWWYTGVHEVRCEVTDNITDKVIATHSIKITGYDPFNMTFANIEAEDNQHPRGVNLRAFASEDELVEFWNTAFWIGEVPPHPEIDFNEKLFIMVDYGSQSGCGAPTTYIEEIIATNDGIYVYSALDTDYIYVGSCDAVVKPHEWVVIDKLNLPVHFIGFPLDTSH
jgi:hypothetical protein